MLVALVLEQESGLFSEVPDARPLVAALREQGLPVGVITNVERDWTTEDREALLEDPALLALFDVVLLSSEAESRPKPAPRIYAEALALLPNPSDDAPDPLANHTVATDALLSIAGAPWLVCIEAE